MTDEDPAPIRAPREVDDPALEEAPALSTLLWRLAVGLATLLTLVVVLGATLREPLEAISAAFIDRFGVLGLFVGVFVMDSVPFTTHEPFLFLAYNGGIGYWTVFLVAGTASSLSGALGWSVGKLLGRFELMKRIFERYRIGPFMRKYGAYAVALAALIPFPYAITTWGAGMSDMKVRDVLLGAIFRFPKVLFYLTLIVLGWNVSG